MPAHSKVAEHPLDAPYQRGNNLTLIGAIALRGLIGEITFPGATDALAFRTYVTQVLVPNLWSGACVVMDNLPAHKVAGIREAIESVGATVIYLSPYSPDFSQARKLLIQDQRVFARKGGTNLCSVRPSYYGCSCRSDDLGYYWLVHSLLLLYFTQLRTAVTPVISNLGGSYIGNLGADLTMTALNGVLGKIQEISGSLADATKDQTKFISSANNLALATGLNLGQAEGVLDELNQKLAKNAADLPGTTEEYVKLANMISSAIAEGNDLKTPAGLAKYKQQLEDIITQYTLIGQALPTLSSEMSADFLRCLIAGKESWGSLKQLQFAQGNPDFQKYLTHELAEQKKTLDDWTKLDRDTRFYIIQVVGKRVGNSEYINRLKGTADAMVEGIRSNLFDPLVGVFGFRRKIEEAGSRTVLDAYTGFLQSWLGLGSTVNVIAQKLGISFDPLKPLVDVIDFVTDLGTQADNKLSSIDLKAGIGNIDLTGFIVGIFDNVIGLWKRLISRLLGFTQHLDTHDLVKAVVGFIEALAKGLIAWYSSFDWNGWGKLVGLWLVKLLSLVIQALIRFNWALIPQAFLSGLLAFFKFLGGLLFGIAEGLLNEIAMILETWVDLILDNFKFFFNGLKWLADTLLSWVDKAKSFIHDPVGSAVETIAPPEVKQAVANISKPVKQVGEAVVSSTIDQLPGIGVVKKGLELLDILRGKGGTNQTGSNADSSVGVSITPIAPDPATPLKIPEPGKLRSEAGIFSPVIHIQANTTSDHNEIASAVFDRLSSAYDRYVQGQLA